MSIPPNSPLGIALKYYPITILLITLCTVLFLWQVATGVDASEPTTQDLLKWGANAMPLSLNDETYRLFTSLVLHIGLLHLMFNMYALYYFGQVAERIIGSFNLLILFILSGIGGNLLSNFDDLQTVINGGKIGINAGASGGIMGIGASLLLIALTKTKINNIELHFKSLFIVMAINLGYGFLVSGINNAGHIGGAITGIVLGIFYVINTKLYKNRPFLPYSPFLIVMIMLIIGIFIAIYWWLQKGLLVLIA